MNESVCTACWLPPRLPRGAPGLGKSATQRRRAQRKAYMCRLQQLCTTLQSTTVQSDVEQAPRIDHRAYITPVPNFDYDMDLDVCPDPPVEEIDASVTDIVLAIDVDKIYLLADKARQDVSYKVANLLRENGGVYTLMI